VQEVYISSATKDISFEKSEKNFFVLFHISTLYSNRVQTCSNLIDIILFFYVAKYISQYYSYLKF